MKNRVFLFMFIVLLCTILLSCGSKSAKNQFFTKHLVNDINGVDLYGVSYLGDDTLLVDGVKYIIPYLNKISSGEPLDKVDVFISFFDEEYNRHTVLLNDEQNKAFALKIKRRLWKARRERNRDKIRKEERLKKNNKNRNKKTQKTINKILGI